MVAAMLVLERGATDVEGGTACVWFEAIFLQMTPSATQLADADQGTIFYLMALPLAPEADVTQLFVHVIPRAIDCGLDAADLPRVHIGGHGGEGIRDVAAEAAISVRVGDVAGGFGEGNPLVGELVA